MINHTRSDKISICMNDLSTSKNNYDRSKPHPMKTIFSVTNDYGNVVCEMTLGNLITLVSIFNQMRNGGNEGPTMDLFVKALRAERGQEAVDSAFKATNE